MVYLPAASVGKNNLDVRWMDGVGRGIKLESGESFIRTASGVVKARGGRWSNDGLIDSAVCRGSRSQGAGGGFEIKSKVRLPVDNERITINVEGKDE